MLDQRIDVETPEQVVFSYSVAGVGSRAAALLLDSVIIFVPGILLYMVASALVPASWRHAAGAGWLFALFAISQFALFWGYHVLFEGLRDGQTPGKRYFKLRVVQDGGFAVGLPAAAVRNVMRVLDMQPGFFYAVGVVSAMVSRSGKRLGDIVAGTMVVREDVVPLATVAPAPAQGAASAAAVAPPTAKLSDDEFALLDRWVQRRNSMDAERRRMLGDRLAQQFGPHLPAGAWTGQGALLRLFEEERQARAAGAAGRSASGARREQHRIVAQGLPRWSAFAKRVADTQRRGLARLSEDEVADFAAEYRALATDLARLQTASRGREPMQLFALSRLVAAGHNLLYRRRVRSGSALRYLTRTVPAEIRGAARPILLAALLLFGPAAIAYTVVVRHPETAAQFIPGPMIDRAEQGVVRARQERGYIDIRETLRPVAASAIIANNVQVTYLALAFGVTAGIGTVLLLVFNGISLGGVMGLYESKGIASLLLSFVAPHGVLELSAICIAGGGGLLLARAILLPGALTRREALMEAGRRAVRLIVGSTLLLVVAGTIEGLFSPSEWPFEAKLWVSALTAVGLGVYVRMGARVRTAGPRAQGPGPGPREGSGRG